MRIRSHSDIKTGLDELARSDPRLQPVIETAGEVPLRLSEPGFAGLAGIIVSQQVSKASADAIFSRMRQHVVPLEPSAFLEAGEEVWRTIGLSRPKQRTLAGVSNAIGCGELDLSSVCELPVEDAISRMTSVKGIGPWTAEVYLLFCAGHADVFPAGDLALQEAIRIALALDERPDHGLARELAAQWSPWRGVAARLLWAYYAVEKRRDAMP
ncbi:MAG: DNA-3-methyladenine glycosylase 2 family protein [Nitratireductor sp.]|nr:DNA-3-methyladenine glycosylase 2 family protein [Nitratireductor sp.]MCC0021801.1 DNA-3-methyladenine glycosylase 2 family protein [Nitratireductor sp.]